jgi:hypothetical protein
MIPEKDLFPHVCSARRVAPFLALDPACRLKTAVIQQ